MVDKKTSKQPTTGDLEFFAYQWAVEENSDYTIIRCYGFTKDNKNVHLIVKDLKPWCYVELPTNIEWTAGKRQLVMDKINKIGKKDFQPMGGGKFVERKKLYYAWKKQNKNFKNPQKSTSKNPEDNKVQLLYEDEKFPFIRVEFRSTAALTSFCYSIKKGVDVPGIGNLELKVHEQQLKGSHTVLKLLALKGLPAAGWIKARGIFASKEDKESSCKYEMLCSINNISASNNTSIVHPKIGSFDIEANSTITSAMPNAASPNDKIFQISICTLIKGKRKKYLFSLGKPDPDKVGKKVKLKVFKTEADLIVSLADFIKEKKLNVLIGYNILGWDFDFLINRAKFTKCLSEFDMMDVMNGRHCPIVGNGFQSKAYTAQKLIYLDTLGVLLLDLLPIIKRDHKLANYRLKTVTTHFGLPTKDPFTPQDIFRAFREFTPDSLSAVGKYCVQDSWITLLLFEKLQMWFGLCEMAKTAHVPIFYLFTEGTQVQMLSQVMEYCMYNEYVMINNGYVSKDGEEDYMGATVLNPVPGKYKKILCFDFASLYPSIMMSHNIDYSTLVPEPEGTYIISMYDTKEYLARWSTFPAYLKMNDEKTKTDIWQEIEDKDDLEEHVEKIRKKFSSNIILIQKEKSHIPDEHCHVFSFEEHSNCDHDMTRKKLKNGKFSVAKKKVICGARYYRFIRAEFGGKGVVPVLLESLISRRKLTRTEIKENSKILLKDFARLVKSKTDEDVNTKDIPFVLKYLEAFKVEQKEILEKVDEVIESTEAEVLSEKECKIIIDKMSALELINKVLDKRQSSYKICANSMYGAMGVKKGGLLPLLPGAMCVTYRGRTALEFISKYIPEKHKGITVYGDSVTGDTPIMVRYPNKTINIVTIDNIGVEYSPYGVNLEKEQVTPENLEVWTDGKWTKINRVIRHRVNKKIYRITTHTGSVDVTEDHSLIRENGDLVKPKDVDLGDKLLHSFPKKFPEFVFLSKEETNSDHSDTKIQCSRCKEFKLLEYFHVCKQNKNRHGKHRNCKSCRRDDIVDRKIMLKYVEDKHKEEDVDVDEAYVWGMFMAEGSCGIYETNSGNKHTWAINNQDLSVLEKCKKILEDREGYDFKILNTMESSSVYKLVPVACTKHMVHKYRKLFYYGYERTGESIYGEKACKIVPYIILNSDIKMRESFFEGYYEGDGEKTGYKLGKNCRFDCKGKIGSQGLFYIVKSLGYKYVSINAHKIKKNIFRITASNNSFRKEGKAIKQIKQLDEEEHIFVYDIDTEEGAFHAGVGELVVKNTDSAMIFFPHITNNKDAIELAEKIITEMLEFFPSPMKLEFEKIYEKYIILTKKRYMAYVANTKGEITGFTKKGVAIVRRENCSAFKRVYLKAAKALLDDHKDEDILNDVLDDINAIFQRRYSYKDFTLTKTYNGNYKTKTLPAHAQLALRMKARGIPVAAGSRIEYLFTTACQGEKKFSQGEKVEELDYFASWREYLRLDYLYYIEKQFIKPLDELLYVGLGVEDFVKKQYQLRLAKFYVNEQILELSKPIIEIDGVVEEESFTNRRRVVKSGGLEVKKKAAPKRKAAPRKSAKKIQINTYETDSESEEENIIIQSDSDEDDGPIIVIEEDEELSAEEEKKLLGKIKID